MFEFSYSILVFVDDRHHRRERIDNTHWIKENKHRKHREKKKQKLCESPVSSHPKTPSSTQSPPVSTAVTPISFSAMQPLNNIQLFTVQMASAISLVIYEFKLCKDQLIANFYMESQQIKWRNASLGLLLIWEMSLKGCYCYILKITGLFIGELFFLNF